MSVEPAILAVSCGEVPVQVHAADVVSAGTTQPIGIGDRNRDNLPTVENVAVVFEKIREPMQKRRTGRFVAVNRCDEQGNIITLAEDEGRDRSILE